MGGAMVLLYASRACYNLAALALAPRSRLDTFDYDWYNVSDQVGIWHLSCLLSSCGFWSLTGLGPVGVLHWCDCGLAQTPALPQADLVNDLGNKGYLVFGLILFVWELLPTTLLVGFFRVHRPTQDLVRASRHWESLGWGLAGRRLWEANNGQEKASITTSSPRAPAEFSMDRSLAPVPTSSTGLGTAKMRAAPGSTAGVRAPGRSLNPTSAPLGFQLAPSSHGDLEPDLATYSSPHAMAYVSCLY